MKLLLQQWVSRVPRVSQDPDVPLPKLAAAIQPAVTPEHSGGVTGVTGASAVTPVTPGIVGNDEKVSRLKRQALSESSASRATRDTCDTEKTQTLTAFAAIATPSLAVATSILSATVPLLAEYPPEVTHLASEYMATFWRVPYQSRPDQRAAIDHLAILARKINQLTPDFDWPAMWEQEGIIPTGDPAASWDEETAERILWLGSVDAEGLRPFKLPSGRWVSNPFGYLSAMRRDVAKGPRHPHAGQVAMDLRDLAAALVGSQGSVR